MTELLTSAQMRAIERTAIESGFVSGLELMERAGLGVVQAIHDTWPQLGAGCRAVVLCGPGNNGGDGYVIARLLQSRGWQVSVYSYGDTAHLPVDAGINFRRWSGLGKTEPLKALVACAMRDEEGPDIIIDSVFGTGLTRSLPEDLKAGLTAICDWRRRQGAVAVSVDIPSGLCADSGRDRGCGLKSDVTVTFHQAKLGHYLADGPALCGAIRRVDIGLGRWSDGAQADAGLVHLVTDEVMHWFQKDGGHKYDHGHALVMAGGVGKGGAARLAARAALRVGAGLVTLGVPPAALRENAARLDAVMLQDISNPDALTNALDDHRITALCLGPGLGVERASGLLDAALAATKSGSQRGLVLDADALTALSRLPVDGFDGLPERCVMTPHGGEFGRLFPDASDRLSATPKQGSTYSKVDAVRAAAKQANCVVLLKGADTVIADASGRSVVHSAAFERATPWLATAGAGDVLAGIVTGLIARGIKPFEAACAGAWLHVEAARAFGPGLIAEDLADIIPQVLRRNQPA